MQKRAEMLFHKESQQQQNDQRHVNLSRRQISTQRSIVDLTSDPEFFHHLHAQFSSVLNQLDADFRFRYSLSQSLSCNSNQDSNELTQQVCVCVYFVCLFCLFILFLFGLFLLVGWFECSFHIFAICFGKNWNRINEIFNL